MTGTTAAIEGGRAASAEAKQPVSSSLGDGEPSLAGLTCARLEITARIVGGLLLGPFAGAALRGGLGHALKRLACTWPVGECPRCSQRHDCLYTQLFESTPPRMTTRLRGVDQIPRPYVLVPPADPLGADGREQMGGLGGQGARYRHGDVFQFHLPLVGRAVGWAKPVLTALAALGRNGLGPGGGRYVIERVRSRAPGMAGEAQTGYARDTGEWCDPAAEPLGRWAPEHWSGARRVQVRFCTPTRVYSEGCVTRSPAFSELVRALLRRVSSLAYLHCGRALELDFARLESKARDVRMRMAQTWWQRQSRYSKRQGQHVDMSGLVGRIEYEAQSVEALAPYRDLLAAGSWLRVGKGTVMGLGKYEVSMAS